MWEFSQINGLISIYRGRIRVSRLSDCSPNHLKRPEVLWNHYRHRKYPRRIVVIIQPVWSTLNLLQASSTSCYHQNHFERFKIHWDLSIMVYLRFRVTSSLILKIKAFQWDSMTSMIISRIFTISSTVDILVYCIGEYHSEYNMDPRKLELCWYAESMYVMFAFSDRRFSILDVTCVC